MQTAELGYEVARRGQAKEKEGGKAEVKRQVIDALQSAGLDFPNVDSFVSRNLDPETREWIVQAYVGAVHRMLDRRRADPRQGWLALPEYEHIPVEAAKDTLENLRARIAKLERRLKNYDYARRSPDKLKADKQELRAMKRLEVKLVPFFAAAPALTLGEAVPLLQASLETPRAKHSRGQAKKAISTRWAKTKNQ